MWRGEEGRSEKRGSERIGTNVANISRHKT